MVRDGVLVLVGISMATDMKVNGAVICGTIVVSVTMPLMTYMKENGWMTNHMAEVSYDMLVVMFMRAIFLVDYVKGKAHLLHPTDQNTRVRGRMARSTAAESAYFPMAIDMKASGKQVNDLELVFSSMSVVIATKANGKGVFQQETVF